MSVDKQRQKERNHIWYEANKEKCKESRKAWYEKNKDKVLETNKKWKENNPERFKELASKSYHKKKNDPINIIHYLLKHAKARASKKGLDFNLTEEDIILPDICPILRVPFNRNTRKYGYSLDRYDPTQGYIKGNVWVISQLANAMKWDSTEKERQAFAAWVILCS